LQKQAEWGSVIMQLDIAKLATLKVRPMERAAWWGPFRFENWRLMLAHQQRGASDCFRIAGIRSDAEKIDCDMRVEHGVHAIVSVLVYASEFFRPGRLHSLVIGVRGLFVANLITCLGRVVCVWIERVVCCEAHQQSI